MKRTTFLAHLKDGPYVYREDLEGLYGICSEYEYGVFDNLRTLIIERISEKEQQVNINVLLEVVINKNNKIITQKKLNEN